MLPLSKDDTFHFELLRVLGSAHDEGADIAEVLDIAGKIEAGSFESWHAGFNAKARYLGMQAQTFADAGRQDSARGTYFRAASYFRAADFFLHGNKDDPRIIETWENATHCFNEAIARLTIPGKRIDIKADGFTIPAIFYRSTENIAPKATLLLMNGYDGSQEEMYHVLAKSALARGFNVLTLEGPGQPTVLRDQGLTFIDEWERVVTPVIDWCGSEEAVDATRIVLMGYSFGGWLAARAAGFEHRLAAVVCVDGLFDPCRAYAESVPSPARKTLDQGDVAATNALMHKAMKSNTNLRWAIEHGCWVYGCSTPVELLERFQSLTLEGVVAQIKCPVLVCDAAGDHFFPEQAKLLADVLGDRATYQRFTDADSAGAHCHVGANDFLGNVVLDWAVETLKNNASVDSTT